MAQCFSTFFLQRNLSQMSALLMEPYAIIQVSIPHRTVVANFITGDFGETPGSSSRNPEVPRNLG